MNEDEDITNSTIEVEIHADVSPLEQFMDSFPQAGIMMFDGMCRFEVIPASGKLLVRVHPSIELLQKVLESYPRMV